MRRRKPFLLMPVITIALVGFLALTGGPMAPVEASETVATSAEVDNTTLALAETAPITRISDGAELTVLLTSYNAVPEQTDANPHITASGAYTNPEVIAARSVDLAGTLPFGTVVAVERTAEDSGRCGFNKVEHLIGYRVIADSMHSRKREQVDILLNPTDTVAVNGKQVNPSLALGMCSGVTVRVVGKIAVSDIPETQAELRKMVEGDALARR